jgi:hypothetical protein
VTRKGKDHISCIKEGKIGMSTEYRDVRFWNGHGLAKEEWSLGFGAF